MRAIVIGLWCLFLFTEAQAQEKSLELELNETTCRILYPQKRSQNRFQKKPQNFSKCFIMNDIHLSGKTACAKLPWIPKQRA